jgi:hypothetical protein
MLIKDFKLIVLILNVHPIYLLEINYTKLIWIYELCQGKLNLLQGKAI